MLGNLMGNLRFGSKVAIIGAGNVGGSAAKSLAEGGVCDEVALFDIQPGVGEGVALDLTQASAAAGSKTKVSGGDNFSVIDGADVVVVTAGRPRQPGETRDVFLQFAAKIWARFVMVLNSMRRMPS